MSAPKAITQQYRNVVYRSRTEARWAYFFDLTATPFQYEPEGFVLGRIRYVPDFWLGQAEAYVEVKPTHPSDFEMEKARRLAAYSGCPVLFPIGNPNPETVFFVVHENGRCQRCFVVEDHDDLGAWVAEFSDGGGWAFPLRANLKNCAAYGTQHEALKSASQMQFNTSPEMDEEMLRKRLRQPDMGDWRQLGGAAFPVLKSARERMKQKEGDSQ